MKKQNNIICTVLLVALIIAIPLAVFLIRDIESRQIYNEKRTLSAV